MLFDDPFLRYPSSSTCKISARVVCRTANFDLRSLTLSHFLVRRVAILNRNLNRFFSREFTFYEESDLIHAYPMQIAITNTTYLNRWRFSSQKETILVVHDWKFYFEEKNTQIHTRLRICLFNNDQNEYTRGRKLRYSLIVQTTREWRRKRFELVNSSIEMIKTWICGICSSS